MRQRASGDFSEPLRFVWLFAKESSLKGGEKEKKEILALLGAVGILAYLFFQALVMVLQPLFNALSGKLH
jgi:hypothetical protein